MSSTDAPVPAEGTFLDRHRRHLTTENRYGLVLLLIAVTYAVSVADLGTWGAFGVVFVQFATVYLALTVSASVRVRRLAVTALAVVVAAGLTGAVLGFAGEDSSAFAGAVYTLNAVLYLLAPVLILVHLVRRNVVDLQTFLGAVAAYLLIGMMFAFAYRAVGELQAGPFFGANGDGATSDDLFFSFITLTTTGYGNLVPAENPGQSLAVLEAITGQLFLVTAVAKIVTAWNPLPRGRGEGSAEAGPADAGPVVD